MPKSIDELIAELEAKRDRTMFELVRQSCQREIDRLRAGLAGPACDAAPRDRRS